MPLPGKVVKVKAGNQVFDAIEQQFEVGKEEWNEYKLLDGGTVRIKITAHRIYRIVDSEGNQMYDEVGEALEDVNHLFCPECQEFNDDVYDECMYCLKEKNNDS